MSIQTYIKETRAEFGYVKWLTRNQVIEYTVLVIALSTAVALFLAAFDVLFIKGLATLIVK